MTEVKRPPFRPRTPIKCLGPYTGMGDPKVKDKQWDEIGQDLYDAGYNMLSVYLILPTPLKFLPIGEDFQLNDEWFENFKIMIDRLSFWRITPKIKFVDQYHEGLKNDPFGKLSEEELYSSWDGSKYAWIKWDEPTPRHYTNFKATSPLGVGIMKYINEVVEICREVKDDLLPNGKPKYPDFKLCIAWANETMALFHEGDHHPYKTRGDREEVLYYIQGLFKDAGFLLNKNLWVDVDYLAFRPDIRHVDYGIMGDVSQDLKKRGQRLEIHGIKTLDDIDDMEKGGVDWRASLFSTDGDLAMADFEERYFKLGHSKYHVDLKLDCKKGQPFFPTNFMKFWRTYFPLYKNFIK